MKFPTRLATRAASGAGDKEKAKRELQEAHRLDSNHIPSRLALARLALAEQRPEDFDKHLNALLELAPDTPDVLRLQAVAAQRAGDLSESVDFASRAFKSAPSTQTLLELATYEKAAGDVERAGALMLQWIGEHPDDIAVRLALANDLQVANNLEAAQDQHRAVAELDTDNVVALNNLAWNLRLDNPEQALEYIRRAALAAPDRPEVLDTLAVIEHINGENRLADRNIKRALAGAPENPSIRYHQAMIGAALGEKDQAIKLLAELLAAGAPDFPEHAEAEMLMQELKGQM